MSNDQNQIHTNCYAVNDKILLLKQDYFKKKNELMSFQLTEKSGTLAVKTL